MFGVGKIYIYVFSYLKKIRIKSHILTKAAFIWSKTVKNYNNVKYYNFFKELLFILICFEL